MPDYEDLIRSPYESESKWFKQNPHVGGYADFKTGSIVMNPHSKLSDVEKKGVMTNEYSRLIMRKHNLLPPFQLTPEQREAFKGYGDERSQRETIVGRIISGDPSALNITQEQKEFADYVKGLFNRK